jgi:hypothetical protein
MPHIAGSVGTDFLLFSIDNIFFYKLTVRFAALLVPTVDLRK